MNFKYLTNIELGKAREDYLNALLSNGMSWREEVVHVTEASGRVTSGAVYADICVPHYNAAAMDGIALDARLTFGASETTPVTLSREQYKFIDTGDALPDDCDAVIMIEDVIFSDNEDGVIRLFEAAAPWQHIRQIGEDICAGEMILPSFSKITPSALGAMIASGVTDVHIIKKPVVGFIPTGDEIVLPSAELKSGDIPEFNSAIFSAMLHEWGAETVIYPIVKDDALLIRETLDTALLECDIVLLGAGSSAGREDYSAKVIDQVGTVLYHGIAIKPGKPAILGYCGEKAVVGIPGYPVSGIIVLEQLVRPIVDFLCKTSSESAKYLDATLSRSVVSTLKYCEFVRVRMGYVHDKLIASPLSRGSGIVTSFMRADGILEVPQGVEGYEGGACVNVRLLRSEEELRKSIVIIGSHDPLIDELNDILKREYGNISITSSHVGSMSGLLAIRKGEAHIAGTHLLDEKTGEYNKSFVQKLIPDRKVKLVHCVKRMQGLILQKGNPKGISNVDDISQDNIRFVNRQKGSGTRILMDYLCKQNNIDTTKIHGYDREEFTHTSVASLIAADSADVGLGVYSAAKMYDLDFLHICDEQYDFLIPDHAWELPEVQHLLKVLKSDELRERLDTLGGYMLENPGEIVEC
ncbi:MAG: molybdopterin biosynthesis protein [Oscillospiraceae bacterium]|nr:molybdopterin biosynthesis protein [Oscillospiraceae bacterium]